MAGMRLERFLPVARFLQVFLPEVLMKKLSTSAMFTVFIGLGIAVKIPTSERLLHNDQLKTNRMNKLAASR
jgi:hypothetical protein